MTPPNSLHLLPVAENNCNTFGVEGPGDLYSLHLLPVGGNNCDKFGVGGRRSEVGGYSVVLAARWRRRDSEASSSAERSEWWT